MKTKQALAVLTALFLLASCGRKVYLDQTVKNKLDQQQISLKKIQFYNVGSFELERNISSEAMIAMAGKIRMKNDKYVELIRFKHKTAAVCDSVAGQDLFIRFEKGPQKYFVFSLNKKGYYELKNSREEAGIQYVMYGGMEYKLSTESGNVFLLARRIRDKGADINKRKVKGLKVDS